MVPETPDPGITPSTIVTGQGVVLQEGEKEDIFQTLGHEEHGVTEG
jgi:hypothetical protein